MTASQGDPPTAAPHLALAVCLAAVTVGPTLASATHEVPRVLDQEHVTGEGGYAAWHIAVDGSDGEEWSEVYLHFGDHMRPVVQNASYAYFGFWLVNVDHGYVGLSALSSIETDGADASVRTQHPVELDRRVAITEDRWEDWMGGKLSLKAGEWLAVAFWSTEGDVDAEMTLGSSVDDGHALVDLLSKTAGVSTFSYQNHEFEGSRNVNLAADAENTCSVAECGPVRNAHARSIHDGSVRQPVDHRLFGVFGAPGSGDDLSWNRGDASATGKQRYVFHGAAAGTYQFVVDEYESVSLEREPLLAVGADVQLPPTVPVRGS